MSDYIIDYDKFYGNPATEEHSDTVITDKRKRVGLEKKIKYGKPNEVEAKDDVEGGAMAFDGGALAFKDGGAMAFDGGALAFGGSFDDSLFDSEMKGLKKGGALGITASILIPMLIKSVPGIINAIKGKKSGGSIDPKYQQVMDNISEADTDKIVKLCKSIMRQDKYVTKQGGSYIAGSNNVGKFFKKAWTGVKGWFDNNKDKMKPFTDILMDSAKSTANSYIDKGVDYVASKTDSKMLKEMTNLASDMSKDVVSKIGSGDVNVQPATVKTVKKKRLNVSNNEDIGTVVKQEKSRKKVF